MGTKPEIQSALIGARLRERRRELGHTQEQAAAILGVGQGTVSRVEQGQSRFSLDLVAPIAAYLGVDVSVLVDETLTASGATPAQSASIVAQSMVRDAAHRLDTLEAGMADMAALVAQLTAALDELTGRLDPPVAKRPRRR